MPNRSQSPDVTVREVGPRDGLQMAKSIMPTDAKLRWIAAMVAAGVPEMEVASFVPPKAMPQMADAAEVTRAARAAHPATPRRGARAESPRRPERGGGRRAVHHPARVRQRGA